MQDYAALTMQRLLLDAGVGAGKRVLDIGCGRGLVTRMVRGLVGPSGYVLGVDRDLSWVEKLDSADRFDNVSYAAFDLNEPSRTWQPAWGAFDFVVGRRVLMYLRSPAETLSALSAKLVPGGTVVFQEIDFSMVPASVESLPVHNQVTRWLRTMIEREGADPHMGFHLVPALGRAGFAVQHVRADALVQCPELPFDVVSVLRAVLPRLLEHRVATEAELGLDTLAQRLAAERTQTNGTFVGDLYFGAWATKPTTQSSGQAQ
jgi:SAM-dependent methyltransferase